VSRTAIFEAENVSLRFQGLLAIDEVTLSVDSGELVGIIGPNGAGKTSFLNCASGLYRPSSGSIRVRGEEMAGRAAHQFVRAGVTRTFQHVELVPDLTVEENVLLARHHLLRRKVFWAALGYGPAQWEERGHRRVVASLLQELNIGSLASRLPAALTLAEQKRVEIARALAAEPVIMLLDEPCSGLAPSEKESLVTILRALATERNLCLIVVEHDLDVITQVAGRLVVMDHGKKLAEGDPTIVMSLPQVQAAYFQLTDEDSPGKLG